MKSVVKLFCVLLVFALMAGICSCEKPLVFTPIEFETEETEETEETGYNTAWHPECDTEPTTDYNQYRSGNFTKPESFLDLADLGAACIGKNADECIEYLDGIYDLADANIINEPDELVIPFLGNTSYILIPFKSIHCYLNDGKVVEVTYAITENRFFSQGAEGGKNLGKDANLDVVTYYECAEVNLDISLNTCYQKCSTFFIKTPSSESKMYKMNDVWIAITYGNDCFGIPGYNLFELAVSTDPDYAPGINCVKKTSDVLDPELEKVIDFGRSVIGKDQETAKTMTEEFLGIKLPTARKNYESWVEYYYKDLDFELSGVRFDRVSIYTESKDNDKVVMLVFWANDVYRKQRFEYAVNFYEKLSSVYGGLRSVYGEDSVCRFDDGYEVFVCGGDDMEPSFFKLRFTYDTLDPYAY